MFIRLLKQKILKHFFNSKVLIIIGPRQSGKTTLMQDIMKEHDDKSSVTFNCDNPTDRELLNNKDIDYLSQLAGTAQIVFIDEAQKVPSIGQTLKLMVDRFGKEKQILATGSSSKNLLESTEEPLTGRKFVFTLLPLSLAERFQGAGLRDISANLENLLVYGMYPEVATASSFEGKRMLLQELQSSYLYKDIFEFAGIKKSDTLLKLVKALALQIGSQVSYSELASKVGIDKKTVEQYIDLLEKGFVVFRLPPYTGNKRREISKLKKLYFYDLGVRNAILDVFQSLDARADAGVLWENFVIVERMKFRQYSDIPARQYFWRTYDGSEIDLVEERGGSLYGYEIKLSSRTNKRVPRSWLEYSGEYATVNPQTMHGFLL